MIRRRRQVAKSTRLSQRVGYEPGVSVAGPTLPAEAETHTPDLGGYGPAQPTQAQVGDQTPGGKRD